MNTIKILIETCVYGAFPELLEPTVVSTPHGFVMHFSLGTPQAFLYAGPGAAPNRGCQRLRRRYQVMHGDAVCNVRAEALECRMYLIMFWRCLAKNVFNSTTEFA